jgi:Concanavalin A-like lectin/glucanases superfamily
MSVFSGPEIINNGLVFHLDAANARSYPGSGTLWADISGSGNNGTLINGPTFNSKYFTFDGVNDTVNCGPTSEIGSSLTGLTVSVWVYPTSQSIRMIMENGTDYTQNTFYLTQENASYFTFEVYGTNYDVVYSNYVYQLNTWYNLTGVWSAGSRVDMYTNGVLTNGTRGGVLQSSVRNGNTNLFVGSRAGTQYPYSGRINQPMLYTRALTVAEVKQNFEATRGRYGI